MRSIKCVVCGDGEVGKSGLIITYTTGTFPEGYIPTIFDNYSQVISLDGVDVELALWDTAGQDEYARLRTLSYADANIFLICFSLVSPCSLENVRDKWVPELNHHAGHVPKILVGTKEDLREDPETLEKMARDNSKVENKKPVTTSFGQAIAKKLKLDAYFEVSAFTNKEALNEVFEKAARLGMQPLQARNQRECSLL